MSAYADIIPWALRRRQHVGTLQFSVLARGDPLPDPRDPRKWGFWSFSAGGDPLTGEAGIPSPNPGDPWPPTIARTLYIMLEQVPGGGICRHYSVCRDAVGMLHYVRTCADMSEYADIIPCAELLPPSKHFMSAYDICRWYVGICRNMSRRHLQ